MAGDDVIVVGAVDDIIIPFVLAAAATYDATQRVYLTYTLTNSSGTVYAGRTSGFGDPHAIMIERFSSHHMKSLGYGNPRLDVFINGIAGYPAIRGREQQLIDAYGGVGSPQVGNTIRGVAYYNPAGRIYYASSLIFGKIAEYNGF